MKLSVGQRVRFRHNVDNCEEPAYVKAREVGLVIASSDSHVVFRFSELRYLILDPGDVLKCVHLPN